MQSFAEMQFSPEELEKQISQMTKDMPPWIGAALRAMPPRQATTIITYIRTMQREFNPADKTKKNLITFLIELSKFAGHKSFLAIANSEMLLWLDSCRKTEAEDPKHKWIGTYNNRVANSKKFFRWIYYPELPQYERAKKIPPVSKDLRQLKRKEESTYTPAQLWTPEEDMVFLKWCPRKDLAAFHAMDALDTAGRPGELLKLTIEEVVQAFKVSPNGSRYAQIVLNQKTKPRTVPLIHSIPYILKWVDVHPMKGNPKAPLFPNLHGRTAGRPMKTSNLYGIYKRLKEGEPSRGHLGHFQRLMGDPTVPEQDRKIIQGLLQKPWNPYIHRHTLLTDVSKILPGPVFNQFSGHSPNSKSPAKYTHYFGAEASQKLLEARGVMPKEKGMDDIVKTKTCPICTTPNTMDALFCANKTCNIPLSLGAYQKMMEDKKTYEEELANRIRSMVEDDMARKYGRN